MTFSISTPQPLDVQAQHCGIISVLGLPNAGKSCLLNALIGRKVSIVSHKAHASQSNVMGIISRHDTQLVFIDTPGIGGRVKRPHLARMAFGSIQDVDTALLVIDVGYAPHDYLASIYAKLHEANIPIFLVLNKIDRYHSNKVISVLHALSDFNVKKIFRISARTGKGVENLRNDLFMHMPKRPWLYGHDAFTNCTPQFWAAEMTREACLHHLHQEIPYLLHVETQLWHQAKNGIRIEQCIYVTSSQHQKMVIGHEGQTIRRIGQSARYDLVKQLECPVHLFLKVHVKAQNISAL